MRLEGLGLVLVTWPFRLWVPVLGCLGCPLAADTVLPRRLRCLATVHQFQGRFPLVAPAGL